MAGLKASIPAQLAVRPRGNEARKTPPTWDTLDRGKYLYVLCLETTLFFGHSVSMQNGNVGKCKLDLEVRLDILPGVKMYTWLYQMSIYTPGFLRRETICNSLYLFYLFIHNTVMKNSVY